MGKVEVFSLLLIKGAMTTWLLVPARMLRVVLLAMMSQERYNGTYMSAYSARARNITAGCQRAAATFAEMTAGRGCPVCILHGSYSHERTQYVQATGIQQIEVAEAYVTLINVARSSLMAVPPSHSGA